MSDRDLVLARVRRALAGTDPAPAPVERGYHPATGDAGAPATVALLGERLADYGVRVHRVAPDGVAAAVAAALSGLQRVIVPVGLDPEWLPDTGFEWIRDDPPLSTERIAAADAVVTAAAVAVADSGTVVLDGSAGQGRRVLSLLPDAMVMVLRADQVVPALPDAIARLDPTRPLTFVSGPSATVDIELVRVTGVHGPRTLDVVVYDPR
ncbi:lactate utilization protein C [Mycobacterium sp. pUA109]|uniref:lactate utilization protein C n=1 Tax=Mycobacterium sp. pUA109 TaxID=3238982 RepID=UPI00351AE91C